MPFGNNHAEHRIGPVAVLRKNSLSDRSERGAATQSVLMSVYRTLKLRGHEPPAVTADVLRCACKPGC